ncbi:dienelactone hydrolase, partial [Rhizobium ruizarguesonis]
LGLAFAAELFTAPPPGIERAAVHEEIADLSATLFQGSGIIAEKATN